MTDAMFRPKLIEVALPLSEISAASAREKSIRHGHPSTLHLWWARRPLAATRAVIWASLVDDPSCDESLTPEQQDQERRRLFGILKRLVLWENTNDHSTLEAARREIERSFPDGLPPVLDPFGGGGAIPLEAARLGLSSISGDLNPVAVLIQRAMLEIPFRFSGQSPVNPRLQSDLGHWAGADGLAADVEAYGIWMAQEAEKRIGHCYPRIDGRNGDLTPIAWIWVRTVPSPNPTWGGRVPLASSWVLRKRSGKPTIFVRPSIDVESQTVKYSIETGDDVPPGTMARGNATCLATGAAITNAFIREQGLAGAIHDEMVAVVADGPSGRVYLPVDSVQSQAAAAVRPVDSLPDGLMSTHPQYMAPPRYGFATWKTLFTPRQGQALDAFVELLAEVEDRVFSDAVRVRGLGSDAALSDGGDGARAYAQAIATYLAFAIDRCAARWTHLAVWNTVGEKLEHVFRLNAFQMTWMHAEGNPFSTSSGNWLGQVNWIVKAVKHLPTAASSRVQQRDAKLQVINAPNSLVSTDPPYYDNVPYADLADFFYVWLRRTVGHIWPEETATILTPKGDELVADSQRHGSKDAAARFFETGMFDVMHAIAERQDSRAPATLYYAYRATEVKDGDVVSTGWDTFLQAVVDAGLTVTATWPIRTEMPGGTRMLNRNVLASSIVIACRRRSVEASVCSRADFIDELRAEVPSAIRTLQSSGITPVDLAQSAIGPGMRIFSKYSRVVETDGSKMPVRKALVVVNEILGEILDGVETALDADSRFALAWFATHGYGAAASGIADGLARAKNTSVAGICESGIAVIERGAFRLLQRHELSREWNRVDDKRLSAWEAMQRVIAALSLSETSAALLLADLRNYHDHIQSLAYVVFRHAVENGYGDEAAEVNGLISAWPDLLAVSAGLAAGQQSMDLT